ncbi:MAG: energy transducer TonB [Acidobacteriales bacterium]|nr:energy transducer TonB [Terriglobales bacterium]
MNIRPTIVTSLAVPAALLALLLSELWLASPCQAIISNRPTWPDLVKWVDPEYPPALWRSGVTGRGSFLLKIDPKTGEVAEVKVLQSTGHTILNELAAKAFLQCKFRPGGRTQATVWWNFYRRGYSRILH